jgi:hypothetical protein
VRTQQFFCLVFARATESQIGRHIINGHRTEAGQPAHMSVGIVRVARSTYGCRYFFTYAMPSAALCRGLTAKLPPCSTKKCFMPDRAASGQMRV